MTEQTKPNSMSEFRRQNPRIDWYPGRPAAAAIERLRKLHPDAPTRWLVDELVTAGIKTFFPDTANAVKR